MLLHTIGFSGKSAAAFFGLLSDAGVQRLIDIRRSNNTLYGGFTRSRDLPFFLDRLCGIDYVHEPAFAPSLEVLRSYQDRLKRSKKDPEAWSAFERGYLAELATQPLAELFAQHTENLTNVCLLCMEPTPEHCHRRLLSRQLQAECGQGMDIIHL